MRIPMSRWTAVSALLLCACSTSEAPQPSISSVTPESVSISECGVVAIELAGSLPVTLDYGEGSVDLPTPAEIWLGDNRLEIQRVEEQGRRLVAEVPSGMAVGTYDVKVRLEGEQELLRPEGFEITGPLALTGYNFEYVLDQVRLRPFEVTVRATGQDAQRFNGRVRLSSNRGTLEPAWSDPFTEGVLVQEVKIDHLGTNQNVLIQLQDCVGRIANTNEFRLEPNP